MPRKSNSRTQLIEAARSLFLEKGYAATSVNDVAAGVGVTKGSFFHHFSSKEELALEVLLTDFEGTADALAGGDFAGIADPVERALAFIDHTDRIAQDLWARGSLLGSFTSNRGAAGPVIQAFVAKAYRRLADGISPIFEPIANQSARYMSGRDLAEQLLLAIEGGAALARAHDDPTYLHRAIRGFRSHLEMLMGHAP
jgi:TetR/AcrR family transcriptional repressor of nem operon